jgi:hypothetical protein
MADSTLPIKTDDNDLGQLSPTDISQFIRLEQCHRFLRLRLHEKAFGKKFMANYHVAPQTLPPLLTITGEDFEKQIEQDIARSYRAIHFAAQVGDKRDRDDNNDQLIEIVRALTNGEIIMLFQPRLRVAMAGWQLGGDIDILRLHRDDGGHLHALVIDMKSSKEVKVEHRLQVGFYHAMIAELFKQRQIDGAQIDTAILYEGLPDASALDAETAARYQAQRAAAQEMFGTSLGLLDNTADPFNYLESVDDLVTGPASIARKIADAPFEDLPYHLSYKCDSCLYNEFCMKWSAEKEDLSLLPYMTARDKRALKNAGIHTVDALARLKNLTKPAQGEKTGAVELIPAAGQEALARRLGASWPIGQRLDELIHRARRYRSSLKKDQIESLTYIPSKNYGSLPYCDAEHSANLVRIYIDAQHDYLNDRIYLLGALVAACEQGVAAPARRRHIVHIADAPPEKPEEEKQLFVNWIGEALKAIVELAAPDSEGKKCAPIHVIFFNKYEQRLFLDGLARHFSTVLGATPLYDFMTQLAAFDSPIATFLDEEIRELKNYPMVCQSLQSVATFLKFDWNSGERYREIFKERVFDYLGKLSQDGANDWYTNRARFNSQIPLEYAYAAWNRLPAELTNKKSDALSAYRGATIDLLKGFQARRLDALEHIARDFKGNHLTEKQAFNLPDLAHFVDKARTLAHSLDEFLTIERHVEMDAWKSLRHLAPERRVLLGETLIARYCEADQDAGVAEQNRENERRRLLKESYRAAFFQNNPQAKRVRLTKEQKAESDWTPEGMRLRLRLDASGLDCDFDEMLALTKLTEGSRLIIYPRLAVDERLPLEQRIEFTPTSKQMLYGVRVSLQKIVVERDENGKAKSGFVEVVVEPSFPSLKRGYVFTSIDRTLLDGKLYTLDSDPNSFYGYWCAEVTEALCEVETGAITARNTLYDRLAGLARQSVNWPAQAAAGQARFLAGLDALNAIGALHDFEQSKRAYIGAHGDDPILLVQGPPGTGKSYSTAFAIFARCQGAIAAGIKYHVYVSCKTHAATDVLLKNILSAQEKLRELHQLHPKIFAQYIDERLLQMPLYRMNAQEPPPAGVIALVREDEKDQARNVDLLAQNHWCIVAATPGGIRALIKGKWDKKDDLFGHYLCHCLVLDEASQMNIPEAAMAAMPLYSDGQLIIVGDHRQMPPIVHHDWEAEPRRTFQEYRSYQSLFGALLALNPPMIKFSESFRLHTAMAEFLRREIYHQDGINYHSHKKRVLPQFDHQDDFIAAVLKPEYPLVVIAHDEAESQTRNQYEQTLVAPLLSALADAQIYNLNAEDGLGVVVPHRMQRAAIQSAFPFLRVNDPVTGAELYSAVDTVERFQGGERSVILISATESDREYLISASKFLLDPRRLTVALSRAKQKLILVAAQTVFSLFDADEETFANLRIWKNLLRRTCTEKLWQGERFGQWVEVWGGKE